MKKFLIFGKAAARFRCSAGLSMVVVILNLGCGDVAEHQKRTSRQALSAGAQPPLAYLSLNQANSARYEEHMVSDFGRSHRVPVQYLPSGGDSVNHQLDLYQEIFRHHYSQPDILVIDTVWPSILADDLIDLKAYLPETIAASAPIEIQNNTVNGRVVAIPIAIDFGVLYYRPTLLERYHFEHPPETWDELEQMARVIQEGERRRGNHDFWGYGWSGGNSESLTCGALEWFLSNSGTNFVEQDGTVRLNNSANAAALTRAVSWIGTISPPGVPLYHESDVENLWRSGQLAFARSWLNTFSGREKQVGGDQLPFELTAVPAGAKGHYGVLGDMSLAISKYSANRDLAITAVKEFTSEAVERRRLLRFGVVPTRVSLFKGPETFRYTLLRNAAAQKSLASLAIRPSTMLGKQYDAVSNDISGSINSVLLGRQTAAAALAGLQSRLQKSVEGVSPQAVSRAH